MGFWVMVDCFGGTKSRHLFRQVKYKKAQQFFCWAFIFSDARKELFHYFLAAGALTTAAMASV